MSCDIYTEAELIELIKAINLRLDKGVKESELNTTQNIQQFQIEVKELREQRDYYRKLLADCRLKKTNGRLTTLVKPRRRYTPWGC